MKNVADSHILCRTLYSIVPSFIRSNNFRAILNFPINKLKILSEKHIHQTNMQIHHILLIFNQNLIDLSIHQEISLDKCQTIQKLNKGIKK